MERWRLRGAAAGLILLVAFIGGGCWGRKFFRMPEETLRTSTKVDSLLEENALLKERIARIEGELRAQQDFARGSNAERRLEIEELKDQLNALQEMLRETQQGTRARPERRRVAPADTSAARTSPPGEVGTPAGGKPTQGAASPSVQGAIEPPSPGATRDTLAQAGRGAGVDTSTAGSAAPAPENVYRQIYLDYNRKEYQLALDESEAFLKDYPDDALGEDVLFIRGSCLMELQNYADAVKEFSNLVQAYPQGRRAPGALLRTAVAYDMLGDKEVAAGVVRRLLKEYPRSEEASAAKERFAALLKE